MELEEMLADVYQIRQEEEKRLAQKRFRYFSVRLVTPSQLSSGGESMNCLQRL